MSKPHSQNTQTLEAVLNQQVRIEKQQKILEERQKTFEAQEKEAEQSKERKNRERDERRARIYAEWNPNDPENEPEQTESKPSGRVSPTATSQPNLADKTSDKSVSL